MIAGVIATAVPANRRAFGVGAATGRTTNAVGAVSAPAGISSRSWPFNAVTVPPLTAINPPSFTVRSAVADTAPLVAEMVVVPGVSAVARPSLATVATLTDDELQVNVAPAMAVPAASRATAASSCDSPGTREPVVGDTFTTATVGGGGGSGEEVGVVGAASAPPQPTTNTASANSETRRNMTETKVR